MACSAPTDPLLRPQYDGGTMKKIAAVETPPPPVTQAEKAVASPSAIAVDTRRQRMRGNRSLAVIAGVAVVLLLYFGAPFFIPLMVALLISFALSPLVDALSHLVRYRVVAAAILLLTGLRSMGWAAYAL